MPRYRRDTAAADADALQLFFHDVAALPIIKGRADYLPLTRAITRWQTLKKLTQPSPEATLSRIVRRQAKLLTSFNEQCRAAGRPRLHSGELGSQLETFLTDAAISIPPALAHSLGPRQRREDAARDAFEDLGWQCVYNLSLLPPALRAPKADRSYQPQLAAYWRTIYQTGKAAKTRLVEGTLRYVITIAESYINADVPYLDLVQAGMMGLMHAAERYDERRSHFQQYASSWIRQRITRSLTDERALIRVPVHFHEEARRLIPIYEQVLETNGGRLDRWQFFATAEWLTPAEIEQLRPPVRTWTEREAALCRRLDEYDAAVKQADAKQRSLHTVQHKLLFRIYRELDRLQLATGELPTLFEIFYALGWVRRAEQALFEKVQAARAEDAQRQRSRDVKLLHKLRNATARLAIFQQLYHGAWSAERPALASFLVDAEMADGFHQPILQETASSVLGRLSERQRQVLALRYGLDQGEVRTLEEVGQLLGVTRERIRQIEANALRLFDKQAMRFLYEGVLLNTDGQQADRIAEQQIRWLRDRLAQQDDRVLLDDPPYEAEREQVTALMQRYITRGRGGTHRVDRQSDRAVLLRELLREAGQPLHYADLHLKLLERLPEGLTVTKTATYTTLFYHRYFQALGGALFGLAEWTTAPPDATAAPIADRPAILPRCPVPLLPVDAPPSAFLESILIGRERLAAEPITVRQFWAIMQAWAGHTVPMQGAFDLWYAAGLIAAVHVLRDADRPLTLTLAADLPLAALRQTCLTLLCERIINLPELLLAIDQLTQPTLTALQTVVFGSPAAGMDVPHRLTLLRALEAVQFQRGEWRLTALGRAALLQSGVTKLPFEVTDAAPEDAPEMEPQDSYDALDLLDL